MHPTTACSGQTHPHGTMRRDEREIVDRAEIDAILRAEKVMYLALADGDMPFMVPVFYAWDGTALYFHSAKTGTKIDIIKKNPNLCFAVSTEQGVVESDVICNFEAKHRTVIGFGQAAFIESEPEKIAALNLIVARFSDKAWQYPSENLRATRVLRVDITGIKGKKHGF